MVNISSIRQSNRQIDASSSPGVAVFVGGTAGIGKITLDAVVRLGTDIKVYVIGRKESEQSFKPVLNELHQKNPNARLIWVDGQVSLLSEVKRICDYIKTIEKKIDLLFLTPGWTPFAGRQNTSEGLDISQALSFYSRICFVEDLLPLLRLSENARVITVLGGGLERAYLLDETDLNLEKPGAFRAIAAQPHMVIMNTLAFERLAEKEENGSVVFIHSHPGIVRTGNLYRGFKKGSWGEWMAAIFMDPVLMLLAFSFKESGERYLYQVTTAAFGGTGPKLDGIAGKTTKGEITGGLFLVNWKCDAVMNEKELAKLRVTAQDAVWEKVHEVIGPYVTA